MAPHPGRSEQEPLPAELVARILAGDRTAEEALVSKYGRGIAIILRRAANGRAVMDDLFQEVFLRAVEKIRAGEVREPERLSGFLCGLARNLAIDHFRREALTGSGTESVTHQQSDPGPGPLDQVLQAEGQEFVRQTLAELPGARDRQLLLRFYIREEDKDRICADLKLSSLQFNRVLHRARERFGELYRKAVRHRSPEQAKSVKNQVAGNFKE